LHLVSTHPSDRSANFFAWVTAGVPVKHVELNVPFNLSIVLIIDKQTVSRFLYPDRETVEGFVFQHAPDNLADYTIAFSARPLVGVKQCFELTRNPERFISDAKSR